MKLFKSKEEKAQVATAEDEYAELVHDLRKGDEAAEPTSMTAGEPLTPIAISEKEFARLEAQVDYSQEQLQSIAELYLGNEEHWPCPRCVRDEAHNARFVRRALLTGREDRLKEQRENEFQADVRKARKTLGWLTDPFGSLANAGTEYVLGPLQAAALVYACKDHGDFYVRLDEEGDPSPLLVYIESGGQLKLARRRCSPCEGLIEEADAHGTRLSLSICSRVLEGKGEWDKDPIGPYAYTCPLHGTKIYEGDRVLQNFPYLLARRISA